MQNILETGQIWKFPTEPKSIPFMQTHGYTLGNWKIVKIYRVDLTNRNLVRKEPYTERVVLQRGKKWLELNMDHFLEILNFIKANN